MHRSESMILETSVHVCSGGGLESHGGDMAFWGDTAVLACGGDDEDLANDGFVILDISDPRHPEVVGRMTCVASASDIAIHRDLVFLAVDTNFISGPVFSPGPDGTGCGAPVRERVPEVDENFFAGIRIISIADEEDPQWIASIPTNTVSTPTERLQGTIETPTHGKRDRGAHGLSIVPDRRNRRLIVYSPNFSGQSQMDIVVVPLDAPGSAYRHSATFPAAPAQNFSNPGCHDIAVFLPRRLAACTSPAVDAVRTTETVLYDITDPLDPKPLIPGGRMQVAPSAGHNHHSATFSWDGRTLIVTDESPGAFGTNECRARSGPDQGVLWFYDVEDVANPTLLATHAPHPVTEVDACHPKQLNVVPLPSGEDVLVASWLGGGTTVVDFTDLNPPGTARGSGPYEVAHYIAPRGGAAPDVDGNHATFPWSSYWYNGYIYANNAWACFSAACMGTKTRGLDVFRLDLRRDTRLDPALRERLAVSFDDALTLPWFNSYVQDCVSPLLYAGPGSGPAHAACAPWP